MMNKNDFEPSAEPLRNLVDAEKIAEGAGAEIYQWGEGRVLRLFFDPREIENAHIEAVAMTAASRVGLRTPTFYGEVTVEGRPGLILERLDGLDMTEVALKWPWRIRSIGRQFAKAHVTLHSCTFITGLPSFLGRVRYILAFPGDLRQPFIQGISPILERLKPGNVLYHGDFHLRNVIVQNGEPVVIDWASAAYGPAEADVAHTLLMIDFATPHAGLPFYLRIFEPMVLKVLRQTYLATYRARYPLDKAALDDWYTVQLLLRLGRKPHETQTIKKLLRKRLKL